MNSKKKLSGRDLAPLVLMALALATVMAAQVKTTTSTTQGTSSQEVTVEKGEVMSVAGNDLFVKMENGEVRHFPNVPESARVTVDGQEMGIHDLKPGMKLQRTITTTTTPQTVTTVQTVTGKVWNVMPPSSVILTLKDGKNQQFTIPKGQKFMVDGQMTDVNQLKKGMTVTATKVVEAPETAVHEAREVTGTMPPPVEEIKPDMPILVAHAEPAPVPAEAPAQTETAENKLPQTGTSLPAFALLAIAIFSLGFSSKRMWN